MLFFIFSRILLTHRWSSFRVSRSNDELSRERNLKEDAFYEHFG